MAGTFLIKRGTDAALSCEALGVTLASTKYESLCPDVCTLEQVVADLTTPCVFAYDDAIAITRDGIGFFKGRVTSVEDTANDKGELMWSIEVRNAWRTMERLTYTQSWPGNPNSPRVTLGAIPEADGTFLLAPSTEIPGQSTWDSWSIVQSILQYAIAQGANFQIGTPFTGLISWAQSLETVSCASAIRKALELQPRVGAWWDYATEPPTIHFSQEDDANPASLPSPITLPRFGNATANVTSCKVKPRNDLLVPAVVLNFVNKGEVAGDPDYVLATVKAPNDSVTGLERSAIIADICLNDSQWMVPGTTQAAILANLGSFYPTGLAAWLYSQLATLFYDGTWNAVEEVPGAIGNVVGRALNLTGGPTAQATMGAMIQTQTINWQTGAVSLRFGTPQQLDVMNWLHFLQVASGNTQNVTTQSSRDTTQQSGPDGQLQITNVKPRSDLSATQTGQGLWITRGVAGTALGMLELDNYGPLALATNTYFAVRVNLHTSGDLRATSAVLQTGGSAGLFSGPGWDPVTGDRPEYIMVPLGKIDGQGNIQNFGNGNVEIVELLADAEKLDGQATKTKRCIFYIRTA